MYSLGIFLFEVALKVLGWFKPHIASWNEQRSKDQTSVAKGQEKHPRIWIHCASLGEFEQIRPVIERLRAKYPSAYILLTFFSPSGYNQKSKYKAVDEVKYIPIDRKAYMSTFIENHKPDIFIGVKYEFWWNLFEILNERKIPKLLTAINIKPEHYIFRWFASKQLKLFQENSIIFTQNSLTENLLKENGFDLVHLAGDPRVDSVLERKIQLGIDLSTLENWKGMDKMIVYGSVYENDIPILQAAITTFPDYKHVIVPHDIGIQNITLFDKAFDCPARRNTLVNHKICLINEVGVLFDLYRLANFVYIGGGFNKNVHNTLEPAVFGLPIAIGPKHKGFDEVEALKSLACIIVVYKPDDFVDFVNQAKNTKDTINESSQLYFQKNKGASEKIMSEIESIIHRD